MHFLLLLKKEYYLLKTDYCLKDTVSFYFIGIRFSSLLSQRIYLKHFGISISLRTFALLSKWIFALWQALKL